MSDDRMKALADELLAHAKPAIRCARCGRWCAAVNDSDMPVTHCEDCDPIIRKGPQPPTADARLLSNLHRLLTPATEPPQDDVEAVITKIDKALDVVGALCLPRGSVGAREWLMSIPARPDYDPDLVIAEALGAARGLAAALRATRDQLAAAEQRAERAEEHTRIARRALLDVEDVYMARDIALDELRAAARAQQATDRTGHGA